MSSKSEKIVFCMQLPNALYQRFHDVTKAMGETKAGFMRKVLLKAIRRAEKQVVKSSD